MPNARELLRGSGSLRSVDGSTSTEVTFEFVVIDTPRPQRPGFPYAPSKKSGTGRIASLAGRTFADGNYQLQTSEGQVFRVQKLGLDWHILSTH